MIYQDIQQVFPSTSSLTRASYFTKGEQDYLLSSSMLSNFPFGKSHKDYIEISVFSTDGSVVTASYFVPSGKNIPTTKSFYDIDNKYVEYSYGSYQSDLVVVGSETKSVFLDVAKALKAVDVQEGNYKVGLQLSRDIVGNHSDPTQKLMIDVISPSRTELSVIPVSLRTDVTPVNTEFYNFVGGKVNVNEVADGITSGIEGPEIFTLYYETAAANPKGANDLMYYYGFKKDVDVVGFITDVYYGVKKNGRRNNGQFTPNDILGIYDQFSNWIYQNYNTSATFDEIRNQYYSLFRFIIDKELNSLSTQRPADYESIVGFLQSIYYNAIFYPVISQIETDYVNYVSGYFKNFINLGDGRLMPMMNTKVSGSSSTTLHDKLIVKLKDPLPKEILVGHNLWLVNTFASPTILQNIYFFSKPVITLSKLRGPNFLIKFENEGNSTETVSLDTLIGETGSLYSELFSKLNTKASASTNVNVDYRYFENFVNFSSAELRLKAYDSKIETLTQVEEVIQDLDTKLLARPDDQFYLAEKTQANNATNAIVASFDGYENFLYNNPDWYTEHNNVYGSMSSASLYDMENQNSLINNVPSFMLDDSLNNDYVTFVGMIGHYFDNLSLFIKQFTEKNDASSSPNRGISMDLVHDALTSLGWEPEISRENLPLLLGSFSKYDFEDTSPLYDKVGNLSENDRNKLVWKRILNSLPFIYKTKGTEASIKAIIACFGIPKNLIKIKEYGGTDYTPDSGDGGMYIFEEAKYEPYFSGSGEYFQLPWTGSINTVEFDVTFDKARTSTEGEVFRLVSCENWVVGASRERGNEWGAMFFSISGSAGLTTMQTSRVPVFDGTPYSVMLRKDDLGRTNEYPIEYELIVKRADAGRIVFEATSSMTLSGSYNGAYQSGSYLYFGNYQQATASLVDPEAFWGNLDEIKLWEIPVDNYSFEGHALHRGGYNYIDPQTMVDKLLFRVSFDQPINLYSYIGSASFNNIAFRGDFPTFVASNFYPVPSYAEECVVLDSNATYPYQFSVKNITQAVRVASYGATSLRSNKVAHVDQSLVSSLSSDHRSTLQASQDSTVDSNKIGVFFSPIDFQNEEILKFFGDYNFGDLIGDPRSVYSNTYREFEKFREIYYSKGFGIVDYQTFMNLVRAYFDKAMFKYIKTVVPARSKLADGLLIEPSILERPKLQLKPVVKEQIDQLAGYLNGKKVISGTQNQQSSGLIELNHMGLELLNDVNHRFYADMPEPYGFSVYSRNGVTYYNGDYYRADVERVKKSYRVRRKYALSGSQYVPDGDNNLDRIAQEISRSYYQVNLIQLPVVTEYNFTASIFQYLVSETLYFSGSVSIPLSSSSGMVSASVSSSHDISGTLSGSFMGTKPDETAVEFGTIVTPINAYALFVPGTHPPTVAVFSGSFYSFSGSYSFDGKITLKESVVPLHSRTSKYHVTLESANPTGSIYTELLQKTSIASGETLFTSTKELVRRTEKSLLTVPENRILLHGYFPTHYKYKKQVFSQSEVNAFDSSTVVDSKGLRGLAFKWKKGSQNKKTTIDASTGNLNSTEPVETKSA